MLFCREAIIFANLGTFPAYNLRFYIFIKNHTWPCQFWFGQKWAQPVIMILVEDRGGGVIIKIVNDLLEFILKWKTVRGTAEED